MKNQWKRKKDAGTIFNPVMYLTVILYSMLLLGLFLQYKQVTWLHNSITNCMTDALLAAATLNEEELLSYGKNGQVQILDPKEKYERFQGILQEEMGLDEGRVVGEGTLPLLAGQVDILDFRIYSMNNEDVTIYRFDQNGNYETINKPGEMGNITAPNGERITKTTLFARIGLVIDFLGKQIPVTRYHMVDVVDENGG